MNCYPWCSDELSFILFLLVSLVSEFQIIQMQIWHHL